MCVRVPCVLHACSCVSRNTVYVSRYMWAGMQKPEDSFKCHSSIAIYFVLRWAFPLAWTLLRRASSKPRAASLSLPPQLRDYTRTPPHLALKQTNKLGIKLRSLCLQGKHFTHWANRPPCPFRFANEDPRYPIDFEFQTNNEYYFSIRISQILSEIQLHRWSILNWNYQKLRIIY